MDRTYCDELIEFSDRVVNRLCREQQILDLLANKRKATIEDIEKENGEFKYIKDFNYVDDTVSEVAAFICIDVELPRVQNKNIKDADISVYVVCHKDFMKLPMPTFAGVKGNRVNNLVREIDYILNGSREFGIGTLELETIRNVVAPEKFACKALFYSVPTFNRT